MSAKGERQHGIDANPLEIMGFLRICGEILQNTTGLLENDPEFREMLESIEHEGLIRLAGAGYAIVGALKQARDSNLVDRVQNDLREAFMEMMSGDDDKPHKNIDEDDVDEEYVPAKDYSDVMFG